MLLLGYVFLYQIPRTSQFRGQYGVLQDDHHDLLDKHHGEGSIFELKQEVKKKDEEIAEQKARIDSLEQELGRSQKIALEKADEAEVNKKVGRMLLENLQYNVVHKTDDNYNGIYVNSNGEKYNGFPVYRSQKDEKRVMYMHAPSIMKWVLQPNDPSSKWSANSYGIGESPSSASWSDFNDLVVTLVTGSVSKAEESAEEEEYYVYEDARPVTWYEKDDFSWLSAGEFCKQHGDQTLCHLDEICEDGKPEGGEREGDIWVPIIDLENDWITLSKRPHGMCQRYSDLETKWGKPPEVKAEGPIWGNKETQAYTKRIIPCCGTSPQE